MATPAALLSILVDANTAEATTRLSKFDRQLTAVSDKTRKGIEARLGANFNPEAFNRYQAAVEKASSRAKNRAAFKAELGANFNNTAFNQYQRAASKAEAETARVGRASENTGHSFRHLARSALELGGAFLAFEAAKKATEDVVTLGEATHRLTAITGMDAKTASTWIETMKVRGVQAKQVNMAFITLSRNIRNSEDGSKKAVAAFKELGVSQDALKRKDVNEVLKQTAEGLAHIDSPARRAALAQQLFGRGAQGLIPILKEGRKGVDEALAATQRYGAYLPKNVKTMEGAIQAQRGMNLAMDGLKITFATKVLPALLPVVQGMLNFVAQMRSGEGAGGQFAAVIKRAFDVVKTAVTNVVGVFGGFGNTVKILIGAFVASKIIAFATALKALFVIVQTNPIGVLLTAVGFLAVAFGVLSNKESSAAISARNVAQAWDQARASSRALQHAHLDLTQAQLDLINSNHQLRSAQQAVTGAADQYGKRSPQYQAAVLALKQANLDHARAALGVRDAVSGVIHASSDQRAEYTKAINKDKERIGQMLGVKLSQSQYNDILLHGATALHFVGQKTSDYQANQVKLDAMVRTARGHQAELNKTLGQMPASKSTTVSVNVDFISNIAGFINSIGSAVGSAVTHVTGSQSRPGHHFSGGMVTKPGYFAGEEAPQHPEIILASNPKYRQRNLDLWTQAGHMLHVPGFAQGGVALASAAGAAGSIDPWAVKTAGSWAHSAADSWLKSIAPKIAPAGGGGAPFHHGRFTFPLPGGSWTPGALDQGWDIAAAGHTPLFAIGAGRIAGHGIGGFGSWAPILNLDGGGSVYYGHAGPGNWTRTGARVRAGQVISEVGAGIVGISTGPHLEIGWYPPGSASGASMKSALGYKMGGIFSGATKGFAQGGIYTASDFVAGPHTASGRTYTPGFAELSNNFSAPLSQLDFSAMGHLPMGTMANVTYHGKTIRIPKIDVGAGGPGLNGHVRGIDLSMEAARMLGFNGLGDVMVSFGNAARRATRGGSRRASTGSGRTTTPGLSPAARHLANVVAGFANIPSQGTGAQITGAGLANAVTVAQSSGDTGAQGKALGNELGFEKHWLAVDQRQLKRLNRELKKRGLSRKQRGLLLQDKLALLQEIGTIEGAIGSTTSSIAGLTPADTGTGAAGSGGSGTDPNQPLIDALNADAAARASQTQAMITLKASLDQQTSYMKSVGEIETRQAIRALSDIISGQIGGSILSRATGSAGDGSVARYGSVSRA